MTHPEVAVTSETPGGTILDRNIAALRSNNAALANDIARLDPSGEDPAFPGLKFSVQEARNGQLTMKAEFDGSEVALHSTYDPTREATDKVNGAEADTPRSHFVLLGFGLGYVVEKLAQEAGNNVRILVVEPHMTAFRLALEHRDLSSLLVDQRIVISLGTNESNALGAFLGRYSLADCTGVGFIELAGRTKLPSAGFYTSFLERLKGVLVTTGGNLQTLMLMAWQYQKNTMTSLGRVTGRPPVRMLFGAFENKPGIIVSAGPSLQKNIEQLKELRDRVVIIAVDTALRPLLNAGIEPHLICTGDPQEANWKHLRGTLTENAYLVAEPMTHPASLEFFEKRLFIASYGDKVMSWVNRFIPDVGYVMCWGSVATMAFDLARKMGCDPIIFMGQDLSFPGGRTYAKGTYFEDEEKQDMSVEAFEKKHRTYTVKDIYDQDIKTNRQMFAYKEWFRTEFSRTEGSRIINATEGGILRDNCEIMTLKEASEQLARETFDATAIIRGHGARFEGYELDSLKEGLFENIKSMKNCIQLCEKGADRIREALKGLETMGKPSPKWAKEVILDLDRYRFELMKEAAMKDFLETANQIGVLNFHRAYKAVNGKDFSRVVFREALDLFADLFISTGRTARGVLPFFVIGFKIITTRNGDGTEQKEELCLNKT